jgi:hypothetical protein
MVDSDESVTDTHTHTHTHTERGVVLRKAPQYYLCVHCPSLRLHAVGFRRIAAASRVLEPKPKSPRQGSIASDIKHDT